MRRTLCLTRASVWVDRLSWAMFLPSGSERRGRRPADALLRGGKLGPSELPQVGASEVPVVGTSEVFARRVAICCPNEPFTIGSRR